MNVIDNVLSSSISKTFKRYEKLMALIDVDL